MKSYLKSFRKIFTLSILIIALMFILPYALPFLLALVTAILFEPVVQWLINKLRMKRVLAVTIIFILFICFIGMSMYLMGTNLVVESVELAHRSPAFFTILLNTLEKYMGQWEIFATSLPPELVSTIQDSIAGLRSSLMNLATTITRGVLNLVAGIPKFLIVTILYLVTLYLISFDLPKLKRGFYNLFTASAREKLEIVFSQLSRATVGFLRAQVILSLLTFVMAFVGLSILRVDYVLVISLLIVAVDILPILGTGFVLVPWAIFQYINGETSLGVGLLILYLAITVIRRVVEPKVLGDHLGISALAAVVSMFIGFEIMGFIGLIIGPTIIIIIEALQKAGFLKNWKIDF